jgi:hypothetical protein
MPTETPKTDLEQASAKGRIIINFCQGVRSDIGIIARISLIVRNLVKQGFWQCANLANTLLGVIWEKLLAITPKWSVMQKVDLYSYSGKCYKEG